MSEPNDSYSSLKSSSSLNALQMLDHVVLWVARVFAGWAAFFALCLFLDIGLIDGDLLFAGSILLTATIWVACTWSQNERSSRLFLAISSVIYFMAVVKFIAIAASTQPAYLKFWIVPIIGCVTMFWTACHPPTKFSNPVNLVNPV